jgi:hypothetical protein
MSKPNVWPFWLNDQKRVRNPIFSYLGLKTYFSSSLRLMIGFSQISRLWSHNDTFWRSHVIQVNKTHMDTCYYCFLHCTIILCIKTCIFKTLMKYPFDYCEVHFLLKWVINSKIMKLWKHACKIRWRLNCIVWHGTPFHAKKWSWGYYYMGYSLWSNVHNVLLRALDPMVVLWPTHHDWMESWLWTLLAAWLTWGRTRSSC